MVNESELRVIHYTLGPLKPWDWWTSWLLKPVDVWQVFYVLFCFLSITYLFIITQLYMLGVTGMLVGGKMLSCSCNFLELILHLLQLKEIC